MSISVVLIDKSEIVEKMLSHCLYYFSAKVSRIENWDENKEKIKEIKPDILFVEWELKNKEKALAFSIEKEMNPTPVVILYRASSGPEINTLTPDQLPHRLIKPFDPKILREKFTRLVPQIKDSKIHPFLKFPKGQAYEKEISSKDSIKVPLSSQKTEANPPLHSPSIQKTETKPPLHSPSIQKTETKSPLRSPSIQKTETKPPLRSPSIQKTETKSPLRSPSIQKTETNPLLRSSSIQKTETKSPLYNPSIQKTETKSPLHSPSIQKTETNPLLRSSSIQKTTPVKQTESIDASLPSINSMLKESTPTKNSNTTEQLKDKLSAPAQKEAPQKTEEITKTQDTQTAKKQLKPEKEETKEFNIDENTQNDLAPMAMKSSAQERESSLKSENIELNEKDILKVLNKYKDTLEFQQLMEKALNEHVTETVTKILQNDNLEAVMEKSLTAFKESKSFKSFVELEIKKYLKKQLPLTIKTVVEEEIKKIIGD